MAASLDHVDVVVVGAGQAGLATSYELTERGVAHVVFEQGKVGRRWRGLWDSFCLVTPNWTVRLPGHPYDGAKPDGFMPRDEIADYLERYRRAVDAPVREEVAVTSVSRDERRGFLVETTAGPIIARSVVICSGAYQRPHRPPAASALPADLLQIGVDEYRNPSALPAGRVLVIGSGQSGCQVAEELHQSGREVFISCGRAPWAPRVIAGKDVLWWAIETGFLDTPSSSLSSPAARLVANVVTTGKDGGHDLHLRTLQQMGVTLLGHFVGADGHQARFALDLHHSVAWSDERHNQFMELCSRLVAERGMPQLDLRPPEPFMDEGIESLDLRRFTTVIFAGGFRPAYESWVNISGAFDEMGFPIQQDGASAVAPGLYFVGVHFLRTRKSALLIGVGEDAGTVAEQVSNR